MGVGGVGGGLIAFIDGGAGRGKNVQMANDSERK